MVPGRGDSGITGTQNNNGIGAKTHEYAERGRSVCFGYFGPFAGRGEIEMIVINLEK